MAPDDLYYDFVKRRIGQCPACGDCLTMDHDCGPLYKRKKKEEERMEDRLREEIHADAREATARQVYRSIVKEDRPDIAIAKILLALDDWYAKGLQNGNTRTTNPLMDEMSRALERASKVGHFCTRDQEWIDGLVKKYRERSK